MRKINKTHMPGFTPTIVTSLRAIRRCRPHFSIEVARQITPSRSKWKSLKYIGATCVQTKANLDSALSTVVTSNNVANTCNIKSDINQFCPEFRSKLTTEDFIMPKRGKKSAGRRAVIDKGNASVIQNTAISTSVNAHWASWRTLHYLVYLVYVHWSCEIIQLKYYSVLHAWDSTTKGLYFMEKILCQIEKHTEGKMWRQHFNCDMRTTCHTEKQTLHCSCVVLLSLHLKTVSRYCFLIKCYECNSSTHCISLS